MRRSMIVRCCSFGRQATSDWPLTYAAADGWARVGYVVSVSATLVRVNVLGVTPGTALFIERRDDDPLAAEVIESSRDSATCAPLEAAQGITPGARVFSTLGRIGAFVGESLCGAATDAWGRSTDALGRSAADRVARIARTDPRALPLTQRASITTLFRTGIGAIDAFAALGHGQRVALYSGAGVGKTTLLRRIVDAAEADARVVALVGERGREAAEAIACFRRGREWHKTTIVCATAEAPPLERIAAVRTATAQAEALATQGRNVLLIVDSLTRAAAAWREIALAGGEAPAHRGHPPSLLPMLAGLVERAGARRDGTITGIYAVLVDGDDVREPVTDAVRALMDGHIALSRTLAEGGRFPAIDVLRSLSRLMNDIASPEHRRDAALVRRAMATLEHAQDLFAIGAYEPGGDVALDAAVSVRDEIDALLFDDASEGRKRDPIAALGSIAQQLRARG